ncbi:hypothetical protein ILYODFUR_031937 [Ilyodon furcidens]|uniref:F-BAR domain-containing protein n=1 Tax=Ilyodon furcidens TaxID=33524 RepID=A0ABV0VLI5_9TELE
MAETAKTLASQQEFMPFRETYMTAFKNDIEYSQLVLQTAAVLQSNKFVQPLLARKNELDKLRKEVKEQWQREQKKMQDADSALRKARLLQAQRQEEYEKAKVSTSRLEEEQTAGGGSAATAKQLEKRRRLEEEALQKAEEARDHSKACQVDVSVKRVDLANTKSEIITQIREMVSQCDLTLKAVTVNWFQLQQAQVVSLPVNHQSLCENAKQYEPGHRYIEFVRSLPADGPRLETHSLDSNTCALRNCMRNATQLQGHLRNISVVCVLDNQQGYLTTPPGLISSSWTMMLQLIEVASLGDRCWRLRLPSNKRSLSGTHSSHSNLSQTSVTSDILGGEDVDGHSNTHHTKIAERRSNGGTDIQGRFLLECYPDITILDVHF